MQQSRRRKYGSHQIFIPEHLYSMQQNIIQQVCHGTKLKSIEEDESKEISENVLKLNEEELKTIVCAQILKNVQKQVEIKIGEQLVEELIKEPTEEKLAEELIKEPIEEKLVEELTKEPAEEEPIKIFTKEPTEEERIEILIENNDKPFEIESNDDFEIITTKKSNSWFGWF